MSLNCEMFFKRTGRIESVQLRSEVFSVPYCNQVKEVTQYRKKRNEKESYIDGWKNGLTSIVKMSKHILGHLL